MRLADILRRLKALETTTGDILKPLPTILPDTASDAEVEALQRAGVKVFRAGEPAMVDYFV